jgi:hypothetical protein
MSDNVYFEGDPGTDSTRRHMERVLKEAEQPRRWPWMLAALGSGGVWLLWQLGRGAARARDASNAESKSADVE